MKPAREAPNEVGKTAKVVGTLPGHYNYDTEPVKAAFGGMETKPGCYNKGEKAHDTPSVNMDLLPAPPETDAHRVATG